MKREETTAPGPAVPKIERGRVYVVGDDRRGKFRLLVADVHGVHVDGRILSRKANRRRTGFDEPPPARPSRKRISVRLDEATLRLDESEVYGLPAAIAAGHFADAALAVATVW